MKIKQQAPSIDSVIIYRRFWLCWKVLGITPRCNKYICGVYDLLVNIFATIWYPLHVTFGLYNATQADVFKNLAINFTIYASSIKHCIFRYKLGKIKAVQNLFAELDKRALTLEEREYFDCEPKVGALRVANLFSLQYFGCCIGSIGAAFIDSERRLVYPAWFPFDWQASTLSYGLALSYQILGTTALITQNLANDIYAPMSLCIMAGHVRLLSMRLAKLGTDENKTKDQNNRELIECIEDHKKLLEIFNLLQDIISYPLLTQFMSSGFVFCNTMVYVVFYVNDLFSYIYYSLYFITLTVQLFSFCYYGSIMQQEFQQLPYAIFKSNWLTQSKAFQQNQRIFTVQAQREIKPLAGGIISIHLSAFLDTCKMAYSLYAVVSQMK